MWTASEHEISRRIPDKKTECAQIFGQSGTRLAYLFGVGAHTRNVVECGFGCYKAETIEVVMFLDFPHPCDKIWRCTSKTDTHAG